MALRTIFIAIGLGVGTGADFLLHRYELYRQREKVFATVEEEMKQLDGAKLKAMKRKYTQQG